MQKDATDLHAAMGKRNGGSAWTSCCKHRPSIPVWISQFNHGDAVTDLSSK